MNSTCELGDDAARALEPYQDYKTSGVQWLGKVPAHWEVAPVKQKYAIRLGKMLQPARRASDDCRISYLKAKHVQWLEVRTNDIETMWATPDEVDRYGIVAGDLLVCEGGEGGRCGIVKRGTALPDPCIIQNALHRVRPRSWGSVGDISRNDYLQYMMSTVASTGWFDVLTDKATIAHFTAEKFGALLASIPPLPEQAAIVRFLDHTNRRIRRYIRAKQKLITLLEEQKQAIIRQAVTGQVDVRTGQPYPAYKPSGVEWLGKVPEHWDVRRNGRLFVQRNETGFPELPILEVSLNTGIRIRDFGNSDRKQIMAVRSEYKRAVKGDIAYNMMRMWQGAVGVIPVDGLVSPAYVVARPLKGTESRYFSALFRTNVYMAEVDKYSHGIVKDRNRLYWENFKQMPTPYPPPDEQGCIVRYLDKATAAIATDRAHRQIDLLREYRTRLIADVVTGKIDVREEEARLPEVDPLADEFDALTTQAAATGMMELEDATETLEELAMENEATV